MVLQRQNVVEVKSTTQRVKELRSELKALDIHEQAKNHDHYKAICESEGIDYFLLICQDSHFEYLLRNNLIERF